MIRDEVRVGVVEDFLYMFTAIFRSARLPLCVVDSGVVHAFGSRQGPPATMEMHIGGRAYHMCSSVYD